MGQCHKQTSKAPCCDCVIYRKDLGALPCADQPSRAAGHRSGGPLLWAQALPGCTACLCPASVKAAPEKLQVLLKSVLKQLIKAAVNLATCPFRKPVRRGILMPRLFCNGPHRPKNPSKPKQTFPRPDLRIGSPGPWPELHRWLKAMAL